MPQTITIVCGFFCTGALQKKMRRLRRAVEELSILNDLARAIGASLNGEEIMQTIICRSLRAVNADRGGITLVEDEQQSMKTLIRTRVGFVDAPQNDARFRGVLTVYNKKDGQSFTADDLRLLAIISAECLNRSNKLLFRSTSPEKFATLFYGVFDPERHTMTYSNAGHDWPFHFAADGSSTRLATGGIMLGLFEDHQYEDEQISFNPGDILVIQSDGISQAMNLRPEEFGEQRLQDLLLAGFQIAEVYACRGEADLHFLLFARKVVTIKQLAPFLHDTTMLASNDDSQSICRCEYGSTFHPDPRLCRRHDGGARLFAGNHCLAAAEMETSVSICGILCCNRTRVL